MTQGRNDFQSLLGLVTKSDKIEDLAQLTIEVK